VWYAKRIGGSGLRTFRQLELTGAPMGDVVSLGDDRRTVHLDLAAGRFVDNVRVIIDNSHSPTSFSAD